MDLQWLRSFLTLAETLHFGRAAAALHMSQSALSAQIKNLESYLRVTLFERDRRSVRLTRAGESLLQDAPKLLQDISAAERKTRSAASGEIGLIRIGFVNSATFGVLPRIIAHYKKHYPGVELFIRNLPTTEQAAALLKQDIDIGFLRLPFVAPEIEVNPIHKEAFVCFLPRQHPLAKLKRIHPRQLSSEPFLLYERRQAPGYYDRVLKICHDSGFSPFALQESSEMPTLLSMVAAGLGVAIMPISVGALGQREISIKPLEGRWPPSEIGTAVLKINRGDPLLARFLTVARHLIKAKR